MQRATSVVTFLLILAVAGCGGGLQTDITSFKRADRPSGTPYKRVMVFAVGMNFTEAQVAETALANAFQKVGVRAYRSVDHFKPDRIYSQTETKALAKKVGVGSALMFQVSTKSQQRYYVPVIYHPGSVTITAVRTGDTTTYHARSDPGYTTGGYTITIPNANYRVDLFDVDSNKKIWSAFAASEGTKWSSYADLTIDAARTTVAKLRADGIY